MHATRLVSCLLCCALSVGCTLRPIGGEPAPAPTPAPAAVAAAPALPATVQFITAEPGDAVQVVAQQLARSKAAQRQLLVYVSAPWCEPCRAFHQAVDRGELTGKLGPLDLLAFDADADAERLLIGGYESRFIPCFAVPGADGKGTGRQIEGSVKGDGAVADLVPRLLPLLQPAPL